MFCYKDKDADPQAGSDTGLVTVNWWDDPVDRPGNRMTGVDSRKGAYWKSGILPSVTYNVQFPQHWVFDTALGPSTELNVGRDVGYDETDAADLSDFSGETPPRATGNDGTPLNFICLAIADCQDWGERSGGQSGWATMGIFRNNGTVFTAATINWVDGLGLDGGWTAVDQITQNILRRLSCACPPAPNLVNPGFEQYDPNGVPTGWYLEGAGQVGPGWVDIGHMPVEVDAVPGLTWMSQGPFWLEYRNYYAAGCWARATRPTTASLRLQSTATWLDFAIAEHPGDGNWHYLWAVGMPDDGETPVFPARVKIQVEGGMALFDSVQVQPVPAPPSEV
jgi:hypothetical protein